MTLNPRIDQILKMVARRRHVPVRTLPIAHVRALYAAAAHELDIAPLPVAEVETLLIPCRDGDQISSTVYRPHEPDWTRPDPALLYFHCGGFTFGSPATHDAIARMFAVRAECVVISVDYRLASEHRFPCAVEDAFDALAQVRAEAGALALDIERLAVGGDSAGATLAAVLAIQARDAGWPICLQSLIYPGTCARQDTASHRQFSSGYLLDRETINWFIGHYLRDESDRDDWRFAPLDAAQAANIDFSGLAPAWIALAEYDPLRDEGRLYGEKLAAAGNQVEIQEYAGLTHEFFKFGGWVPEVALAHADAVRALRCAFGCAHEEAAGADRKTASLI